jgi:hypothetical protein
VLDIVDPVDACAAANCTDACGPPQCNPVTNEGCDTAMGEACDYTGAGFTCFPPPNNTPVCDACDIDMGPFCAPGERCLSDGGCARYCCDDGDCGTGRCDKFQLFIPQGVGVCVKTP